MAARNNRNTSISSIEDAARHASETLRILTQGAVDHLEGVYAASITVATDDGPLQTLAPTDPVAGRLDELQYQLREGPCYQSATGDLSVVADDVAHDPRWPAYGPSAARLGVRAQVALCIGRLKNERMALNLYSREVGPFSTNQRLVELFVSHAALVTGHLRLEAQLTQALSSRKVIGQAIGLTMATYALDEQRAFDYLVRESQRRNLKLREICAELVEARNGTAMHPPGSGPTVLGPDTSG